MKKDDIKEHVKRILGRARALEKIAESIAMVGSVELQEVLSLAQDAEKILETAFVKELIRNGKYACASCSEAHWTFYGSEDLPCSFAIYCGELDYDLNHHTEADTAPKEIFECASWEPRRYNQ